MLIAVLLATVARADVTVPRIDMSHHCQQPPGKACPNGGQTCPIGNGDCGQRLRELGWTYACQNDTTSTWCAPPPPASSLCATTALAPALGLALLAAAGLCTRARPT